MERWRSCYYFTLSGICGGHRSVLGISKGMDVNFALEHGTAFCVMCLWLCRFTLLLSRQFKGLFCDLENPLFAAGMELLM